MPKNALEVKLPVSTASELARVATSTQRSTAFIAQRALLAGAKSEETPPDEPKVTLLLQLDEDDPASLLAKIKSAAGKQSVDEALAKAWAATRHRFTKFLEKETAARQAEAADDLDAGLAQAADPTSGADLLARLARSEYPRIRALVAAHPNTSADVCDTLARDREPYVREAVENRQASRRGASSPT